MSGNYNVDDILAEISAKRQKENAKNMPPQVKKASEEKEEVPFRLTGMTAEFSRPDDKKEPMRSDKERKPSFKREDEPKKESFFKRFKQSAFEEEDEEEEEEAPAPAYEKPSKKRNYFNEDDLDFTLTMEIDSESSEKRLQYEEGRTVVLPKVRELNKQLNEERQEKIRDFMENSSFDEDFDDDDDGFSFSFGDKEKSEFKKKLGLKKSASYGDDEEREEKKVRKKRRMKDTEGKETFRDEFDDIEYTSPSDIPEIMDELASKKKSAVLKLFITAFVFLGLLYLSLCNIYPLPLVSFVCPENNMRIFILVNLIVFLIGAMAKASDIGSGLKSFFTLKSNNDAPAAIAAVAVILQGCYAAFKSDYIFTGEGHLYFAVAGLILFMNSFGKMLTLNRVQKNFKIVSEARDLRGEFLIEDSCLASGLSEGQGFDEANISYSKKVKFPSDFMSLSFSDNYFEQYAKIITPLFVVFGLIISLISFFLFGGSFNDALTVFTVVMCMASPLTATIVSSLPLYKSCCALSSEGSFVAGYDSVDKFEETNGILIDAKELYRQEDVILHGIKVFGDMRIDKSLVEAASLMYASDGLLKEVFLDTLEGQLSMLKKVTDLKRYTGGVGGMVGGKEVLMGSRELMERFSVALPSREYEKKFMRDDGRVIFLSSDGVLSAMIVVSYRPSEDAMDCLDRLRKYAPALIVRSDDPNIDEKKIAEDFDYQEEYIKIAEEKYYKSLDDIRHPAETGKAYAMASNMASRLRLITALVTLKRNITVASVFQMTGLILGYAMVALMAFTGNLGMLGFIQIIIYQLFWAICIVAHGAIGRY